MKANSYEMIIWWSAEDDAYVVDVPEPPSCMSHGGTRLEAMKNAEDAIKFWIKTARRMAWKFRNRAGGWFASVLNAIGDWGFLAMQSSL